MSVVGLSKEAPPLGEFVTECEHDPGQLAYVFFQLRARRFGISDFSFRASLQSYKKSRIVSAPFKKLSRSLIAWQSEGLSVDVGDYFQALFDVFGEKTYPTHVVAECGLSIYFSRRVPNPQPELDSSELRSYRERQIASAMRNFGWSRSQVLRNFEEMLPDE